MNIKSFNYEGIDIEFDLQSGKNVMVNATEMSKVFGKDLFQFTKSENTKQFILSCQKPAFAGLLNVNSEKDLIISKQKSGTWMHEVLALKFAAWLNPDFEVWVYMTIRNLLYEFGQEIEDSISETVKLKKEQDQLKNQLAKENPTYMEILKLDGKINDSRNRRRKATKLKFSQVKTDLFTQNKEEE